MIKKNKIILLCILSFLNGCVQNTALLGPAYTLSSTGNIYQAGISYGSSKAVIQRTGKSITENIKNLIDIKKPANENEITNQNKTTNEQFFELVQKNIDKKSKILNLSN